jgi:hypothetical protein
VHDTCLGLPDRVCAVTSHGNPMLPCWSRGRSTWLLAACRPAVGPVPGHRCCPTAAALLPRTVLLLPHVASVFYTLSARTCCYRSTWPCSSSLAVYDMAPVPCGSCSVVDACDSTIAHVRGFTDRVGRIPPRRS